MLSIAIFGIVTGLWANMLYYEYRYKKPGKGLNDITEAYGAYHVSKKHARTQLIIRGEDPDARFR